VLEELGKLRGFEEREAICRIRREYRGRTAGPNAQNIVIVRESLASIETPSDPVATPQPACPAMRRQPVIPADLVLREDASRDAEADDQREAVAILEAADTKPDYQDGSTSSAPTINNVAIGYHALRQKWIRFRRYQGEWREYGVIAPSVEDGSYQTQLLKAFA